MKYYVSLFCGLLLTLAFLPTASAAGQTSNDTSSIAVQITKAMHGKWRSASNVARDKYRHPLQTLEFFGLKPDMTVIELLPGSGWYTEILAPVLRDHGQLVEALYAGKSAGSQARNRRFTEKLHADRAVYGKVSLAYFKPPRHPDFGPPNSADMLLTFRNTHDLLNAGELEATLAAAFRVLKPGGVLGIVDHRARPAADAKVVAKKLHRITEDYMIEAGLRAGFILQGVSQINANPKDPGDIPIFRLPPSLDESKAQQSKYKAIGETDRMTLKFVKPQ